MPHLYIFLGLMFLALIGILLYFLAMIRQFLTKFWHIFLPRPTVIAIASFQDKAGRPTQVFDA